MIERPQRRKAHSLATRIVKQFNQTRQTLLWDAKQSYQILGTISRPTIALVAVAYGASFYVEQGLAGFAFDTGLLRTAMVCVIASFAFRDQWPIFLASRGHLVWITAVGTILPYCFGTILVANAALSRPGAALNYFAISEYILSLFFLTQLMFTARLTIFVWAAATLFAVGQLFVLNDPNWPMVWSHIMYVLPFGLTILLFAGIINRAFSSFQQDKEQAVWNVSNAIAHQLRTPLATIRNLSRGTDKHLNALTTGYEIARALQKIDDPISRTNLDTLKQALQMILKEVQHSGALIDILIANSRPFQHFETPSRSISIRRVTQTAIDGFPYNSPQERSMVGLGDGDFEVFAQENMLLHVMFNLIGNAVEFAQKRPNGTIKIWFEQDTKWNKAYVWDSGAGIPKRYLHQVFDPFFSRNSLNGTGIGLSFCKAVMEGIGGRIEVDSIENSYCCFRLSFPKV